VSVRTELDVTYSVAVPKEWEKHSAGRDLPDADRSRPAGRSDTPPIRAKGHREYGPTILKHGADRLAARCIPNAGGPVPGSGQHSTAVRAETSQTLLGKPHLNQLRARCKVDARRSRWMS